MRTTDVLVVENPLRTVISDAELELAGEDLALMYTAQTSSYSRCCN